jgi:hypothetical protein
MDKKVNNIYQDKRVDRRIFERIRMILNNNIGRRANNMDKKDRNMERKMIYIDKRVVMQ